MALGSSVAGNSQQTHPAPYYTRIRRLPTKVPERTCPCTTRRTRGVSTDATVLWGSSAVLSPDAAPPLPSTWNNPRRTRSLQSAAIGVEIESLRATFCV